MADIDCPTCASLIDAYVDGELSADVAAAVEQALPHCPDCRRRLEEARILRDALGGLPQQRAPAGLRAAILAALPPSGEAATAAPLPRRRAEPRRRDGLRWAAGLVLALGAGWAAGRYLPLPADTDETREVVDGYLRLTSSDRPVEVASSDRHTVKPWFSGRIAYAPPVHDLTTDGFPLVGGRVDVVNGRKIAVLVYQRNRHLVALFVWPDERGRSATAEMRDGFSLRTWSSAGFALRAISDLPASDLERFAAALDKRIEADR